MHSFTEEIESAQLASEAKIVVKAATMPRNLTPEAAPRLEQIY
jgi:hypothetical protein